MRVLVDVNVFMDVLQARKGVYSSLGTISLLRRQDEHQGYVSALTVPILHYLECRDYGDQEARRHVQKITKGFVLVDLTEQLIREAFDEEKIPDFEDCIQYRSATTVDCQAIVTRNTKDFGKIELDVYTPEGFLEAVSPAS